MIRLIVACAIVGILSAATVAWHIRESSAYAAEAKPPEDLLSTHIQAFAAGCLQSDGRAEALMQGGAVHLTCDPGLGVAPVPPPVKRGRR